MKSMAETDEGTADRLEKTPGTERRRRRGPPVLAISLLLSALIHVFLIVFYPIWMQRIAPESTPPLPPPLVRPVGTEVVAILEVADPAVEDEPEAEDEPDPVPRVMPPAADQPEPDVDIPDRDAEERSAAERLRPDEDNTRLWVPLDRAVTDLTAEEQLQLEIGTAIEAWNDSVGAAAERAAAATDWTATDADGNRWGVSPGKLHLGKVTLPLPFGFGPANGIQRDELAKRAYELNDIDRAAATGLVRETTQQRAKEMRERADAERAARLAAERALGQGAQSETPPDTTQSRR